NAVDWGALLGIMGAAADAGLAPFREAVRVQERLFTSKPVFLGVEQSLKHPDMPCGLKTDAERARHVRKRVRQMLNSRGEWQMMPTFVDVKLGQIKVGPALKAEGGAQGELAEAGTTRGIGGAEPGAHGVTRPTSAGGQGEAQPAQGDFPPLLSHAP